MVYETAALIALLSIVIIYLQLRRGKNKPEDNRLEAQTVELRQINKQLQQGNNLFTAFIVQIIARFKQTEAELKAATTDNNSLKQTVQRLQQQLASVESERDEVRKISTNLRIENVYFEQKIEELEAHKKVLIQELGGSLSSQDIEFITWEFLIEKVKEVTRQLNEVIAQNQSLIKTNTDLQQERDVLRRELNQVKDNNTRLTQDNLQLRASKNSLESELRRAIDRIQPLEIDNNQLEQEKTQLERKLYELNSLNSNSRQLETKVKQLEENARDLEKAKISLELQLKDEKSRVALLQQEIESLRITTPDEENNRLLAKIAQLEEIIKELREEIESLRIIILTPHKVIITPDEENNRLRAKIAQLEELIKKLLARIAQLLEELIKKLEDFLKKPDGISLLKDYNDLVYFVQTSLKASGIEELNDWEKTEDFYIELISRLCFIDTILVTKIRSLECELNFVYHEDIAEALDISFSYPGKFLFWSNGEMWWELSYFFNSKL
jgi:chromosome segregation ATPase